MIFISRFTNTGHYPELADKLRRSLDSFSLRHSLSEYDAEANWNKSVHRKPLMILSALLESREPVCWLDADCEVCQLPSLLLNTAQDFAAYNWHADQENVGKFAYDPTRLKASGGVLMFGYTAPALELLMRWVSGVMANPDPAGTDPVLDRVFNRFRPPVNPLWLPKSYNRHDSQWPNVKPVINHVYRERGHSKPDYPVTYPPPMFMFHYADVYDGAVQSVPNGQQAVFVEVGCWMGDSSSYMARRIKESGKAIKFYCVDTWKGSAGVEWMKPQIAAVGGDMLPAWKARMERDGVAPYATPIQLPSVEAAQRFADRSIDFLMLDGDHAYEAAKADIRAWLPKLKPMSILCGDDYDDQHPGVPQAVNEVLGKGNIELCGRTWMYRVPMPEQEVRKAA